MKKKLYILPIIFLLTACASQTPAPVHKTQAKTAVPLVSEAPRTVISRGAIAENTPAIKVALIVPLTGESAAIGKSMVDAASLALYDTYLNTPSADIHAQITLIPKDSGASPAENINATKQAIEQGASFVIGPLFSQSVKAIAPTLNAKNIAMLSFSNNKAVAAAGVYTFGFLPEQQVARVAEYAYLNKYQRVALLAPNDAYGEKMRDSLTEIYVKNGGCIAPSELYAPSVTNIEAAVSRIAASYNNAPPDRRFQAIFVADSGNQMQNIVKSLTKNRLDLKKIKLISLGLLDNMELAKIPEMQGAWFPNSPAIPYSIFEKRFTNAYGNKPVRLAALAYDATAIAAQIAMKGEGINTAAITNKDGFLNTANGLVRLQTDGKSDRKLDIVEITSHGLQIVDQAPKSFSE